MSAKTHNRPGALEAKAALRRHVLELVQPARVLDAYCGPIGEMHRAVWHGATSYVGIDQEWRREDARTRFVGDTCTILRAIDLNAFNVFDLDAFGSPWDAALIVAARRAWEPGERGAVVFTDGSGMCTSFGDRVPRALGELVQIHATVAAGRAGAEALHRMAVTAWARRAGVEIERRWLAVSLAGAVGALPMFYSAAVFTGAAGSGDQSRARAPRARSPQASRRARG